MYTCVIYVYQLLNIYVGDFRLLPGGVGAENVSMATVMDAGGLLKLTSFSVTGIVGTCWES